MSRLAELTRPISGIQNRTAEEVFDIMADRIRYALRTADTEPGGDVVETGWVIEHGQSPAPLYWTGKSWGKWSGDHREACRFARREDAFKVSLALGDPTTHPNGHKVVEHAWRGALRTADAELLTSTSVGDSETADTAVNAEPGGDVVGIVKRECSNPHCPCHERAALNATQPTDAEVREPAPSNAYGTTACVHGAPGGKPCPQCEKEWAAHVAERLAPSAVRREEG